MNMYPHQQLTRRIIGAAIAVHRAVGPGQDEPLYEEALLVALHQTGVAVEAQKPLPVIYKGVKLECGFRPDLVVERAVVVEAKSVEAVLRIHLAQLMTYQRLGGWRVGLLLNFNEAVLKDGIHRRVVDPAVAFEWEAKSGTTEKRRVLSTRLEEEELTEGAIGAAAEVHRWLGPGLLPSAYHACLLHELRLRNALVECGRRVPVRFGNHALKQKGELPLLLGGRVLVQLHAVDSLRPVHEAQLLAGLRLSCLRVGLLVNFNAGTVKDGVRRILNPDAKAQPFN